MVLGANKEHRKKGRQIIHKTSFARIVHLENLHGYTCRWNSDQYSRNMYHSSVRRRVDEDLVVAHLISRLEM